MSTYHISIHIEVEADDLFIAKRKADNICNNLYEGYNPFIESIIEEKWMLKEYVNKGMWNDWKRNFYW